MLGGSSVARSGQLLKSVSGSGKVRLVESGRLTASTGKSTIS